MRQKTENSIIIVGAGVAGLAAGCYARMNGFRTTIYEMADKPAALVFWNSGVKLACEGLHVLSYLERLEKQGVEILACTTCLEFYDLVEKLKVGKPTTMVRSIQSMMTSEMVCL